LLDLIFDYYQGPIKQLGAIVSFHLCNHQLKDKIND